MHTYKLPSAGDIANVITYVNTSPINKVSIQREQVKIGWESE